jgi:flagellar protein FliO/FliZ
MIGGPTDVVVETNIVRSSAATARENPAVRNGNAAAPSPEPPPRTIQPEPPVPAPPPVPTMAARPERSPRFASQEQWSPPNEPALQPVAPPPVRPARSIETNRANPFEVSRPGSELHVTPQSLVAESASVAVSAPVVAAPSPTPVTMPQPQPSGAPDQSIAEMAQKLEAALRRPGQSKSPAESGAGEPKKSAQRLTVTPAPRPNASAAASQTPQDLEQEMARMLTKPGAS